MVWMCCCLMTSSRAKDRVQIWSMLVRGMQKLSKNKEKNYISTSLHVIVNYVKCY